MGAPTPTPGLGGRESENALQNVSHQFPPCALEVTGTQLCPTTTPANLGPPLPSTATTEETPPGACFGFVLTQEAF